MNAPMLKRKVDEALQMGRDLVERRPNDSTLPIVIEQLVYLEKIYERDRNFRAVPAGKLTIGVIAAKEYETSQPKFASILGEIDYAIDHQV
jgi:hypothetical protein